MGFYPGDFQAGAAGWAKSLGFRNRDQNLAVTTMEIWATKTLISRAFLHDSQVSREEELSRSCVPKRASVAASVPQKEPVE